jgi:hypothetical protein
MVNELERSWYPDQEAPPSAPAAGGGELPAWMTALLSPKDAVVEPAPADPVAAEPRSSLSAAANESSFGESADAITLTAAVSLLPGAMSQGPSAKFLEAFRAYEKAKNEREAEKALREQRKRKPPS